MSISDWSVPETEVMDGLTELLDGDRRAVLATVIDVEGNAYRRPGAKMVIAEDGGGVGAITAGCLEDDVLALAAEIIDDGTPRVETYDLMEDDDDVWGLGVGCNGIIDVLVEPLDETFRPVAAAYEAGENIAIVTVLDSDDVPEYTKAYYRPGEGFETAAGSESLPDWLTEALSEPADELTDRGRGDTVSVDTDSGSAEVFIDGIAAPPELVVFGTGHDVGPVVELANKNGFRVTVLGFRGATATPDRFPMADDVRSTSPARVGDAYDFDDDTYAVIMTHNFIDDRLTFGELVDTPVSYIGLMGPRERFEEMLEDFVEEGRAFSEADLDNVYTPVGLDLGGGSPYQIAHSIIAEVLAVHNDRTPRHLKDREGPIHDRLELEVDGVAATDD